VQEGKPWKTIQNWLYCGTCSDWFHKGFCMRVGGYQTENFEIWSNYVVWEKVTYICMQLWGTAIRLTQQ